jgi:hypothetical protein
MGGRLPSVILIFWDSSTTVFMTNNYVIFWQDKLLTNIFFSYVSKWSSATFSAGRLGSNCYLVSLLCPVIHAYFYLLAISFVLATFTYFSVAARAVFLILQRKVYCNYILYYLYNFDPLKNIYCQQCMSTYCIDSIPLILLEKYVFHSNAL